MSQDIRELFKHYQNTNRESIPEGHRDRFMDRLEQNLPQEKVSNSFWIYKMAAVFVVAIGIAAFFLFLPNPLNPKDGIVEGASEKKENVQEHIVEQENSQVTLADISPQFKKVEEYYLANLNLGLSKLEITEENKALIDAFMAQLAELDQEYNRLNKELRDHGFNTETIEALIQNLQLRLDLLYKLNSKLNELKQDRNENYNKIQA